MSSDDGFSGGPIVTPDAASSEIDSSAMPHAGAERQPGQAGVPGQARVVFRIRSNSNSNSQVELSSSTFGVQPTMDSFLHLARPLGPASVGNQPSTAPLNVSIHPQVSCTSTSPPQPEDPPANLTRSQAIFSILDHSLRRNADQERVIGTLLGVRSEDGTEIEIRNCYAVPHTETAEQVEVDMDYQKQMLALHLRANPREVLVGWYATSAELNTFSALIQNFYSQQGDGTFPHPAVHLTMSTEPGKEIDSRTYISAPIGVTAERAADSCLFIPVPHTLKYGEAEKSGMETIAAAMNSESRTGDVLTDLEALEEALVTVIDMIDRVRKYVSDVLDEERPPSTALGQYLMNALSLAPKVDPAEIEKHLYVDTSPSPSPSLCTLLSSKLTCPGPTTSRTCWWSPTSPTRSARRSTCRTGWQRPRSPRGWATVWAAALAALARAPPRGVRTSPAGARGAAARAARRTSKADVSATV